MENSKWTSDIPLEYLEMWGNGRFRMYHPKRVMGVRMIEGNL